MGCSPSSQVEKLYRFCSYTQGLLFVELEKELYNIFYDSSYQSGYACCGGVISVPGRVLLEAEEKECTIIASSMASLFEASVVASPSMVVGKGWTSGANGSVGSAVCMAVAEAFGIGTDEKLQVVLVVYDFSYSSKCVDAEEAEFNISWSIFNIESACSPNAVAMMYPVESLNCIWNLHLVLK
ncbi:hypothetical protein RHSIM_Rhsim07G0089900 [Rhododendron simsii]|uniref:Uncharacterized protein n=1 Tax=Rhododendron simsii TaxID=118357 RepID=A0A834LII5_RHOSS|nr:hypothetical protein RHSIM_Rhsim07G0089900 [Rhododendron simsii]